jgi:hypothetical protein
VIDVTDRPDIAMRLRPLKFRLRHGCGFLFMSCTPALERVVGIEPT